MDEGQVELVTHNVLIQHESEGGVGSQEGEVVPGSIVHRHVWDGHVDGLVGTELGGVLQVSSSDLHQRVIVVGGRVQEESVLHSGPEAEGEGLWGRWRDLAWRTSSRVKTVGFPRPPGVLLVQARKQLTTAVLLRDEELDVGILGK